MAARFPTQLPNLPNLATISQAGTTFANINLSNELTRQWMADVSAELLAIATRVGITGTSDASTLLYQVAHSIPANVPSVLRYNGTTFATPTAREIFPILPQRDRDPR